MKKLEDLMLKLIITIIIMYILVLWDIYFHIGLCIFYAPIIGIYIFYIFYKFNKIR